MRAPIDAKALSTGGVALPLACLAVLGLVSPAALAAGSFDRPDPEVEIIFQTAQLRIYRTVDKNGRPATVVTNLDAEGNPLDAGWGQQVLEDRLGTGAQPAPIDEQPAADPNRSEPQAGASPARGAVKVSVRSGDGPERPADDGEIEVRGDEAGGTTVVININNNPPPPAPAPPPAYGPTVPAWPVVLYGGIVGPFRYPEHHHFLGYGLGVRSPSSFSALGLRASDRFLQPDPDAEP
jgi:hypothetical protein